MHMRSSPSHLALAMAGILLISWLTACAPAVEDAARDPAASVARPSAAVAPIATVPSAAATPTPTASSTPAERLVVALAADVPGFDPREQRRASTTDLIGVVLEPLVALERDFSLRPRLATAWEIADDGPADSRCGCERA